MKLQLSTPQRRGLCWTWDAVAFVGSLWLLVTTFSGVFPHQVVVTMTGEIAALSLVVLWCGVRHLVVQAVRLVERVFGLLLDVVFGEAS